MVNKFIKKFSLKMFACMFAAVFALSGISLNCCSVAGARHTSHGSFNTRYAKKKSSESNLSQVSSEHRRWMSDLPDTAHIVNMSIPGTHDSGTYNVKLGAGVFVANHAECQSLTITEQLNIGIRYFDIRTDQNGRINHGGFSCIKSKSAGKGSTNYLHFSDVLMEVNNYLNSNPREVVFIQIKAEDNKGSIAPKINSDLAKYAGGRLYDPGKKKFSDLTLGDVRGKIVAISRADGIDQAYKCSWSDNCVCSSIDVKGSTGKLQDKYEANDPDDKYNAVTRFYSSAGNNNTVAFIDFTSFFRIAASNLFGGIRKMAGKTWGKLSYYFTNRAYKVKKAGVVLFDFPEDGQKEASVIYITNRMNKAGKLK